MTVFQAIVIAVVEGLTEFLPVSSTGHMVIVQALLGLEPTEFTKAYMVNIQFGAILSVVALYWKRFFRSFDFYWKLLVAFIPAAIFGLLLGDAIDLLLENVTVVAVALLLGGIVLLFVDNWFKPKGVESISYPRAFGIGIFQCLAMVPGAVSYTHLRAHETVLDLVCRLLLEKKQHTHTYTHTCSNRTTHTRSRVQIT